MTDYPTRRAAPTLLPEDETTPVCVRRSSELAGILAENDIEIPNLLKNLLTEKGT